MSRNGSGVYNLPSGNPVVTGTTITTTWANTTLSDIASSLTGSVASDGQTPMSGSLNMANNKILNVTDPTTAQDAATKAYVDAAIPSTSGFLVKASNLSDVDNATTSRANLGLGSIATQAASAVAITGGTITGLSSALPIASGGTGATTLDANNVLLGNGTSALQTVAPGTSGNVLTSNGTTWTSAAAPTSLPGVLGQVFTASGTFTIPTGVTALKVTVVGGGGGGDGSKSSNTGDADAGAGGGGGGAAIKYFTGLTPGNTLSVTIGAGGSGGVPSGAASGTGGTSNISSGTQTITTVSASGGVGGGNNGTYGGGNGGVGTSGTLNINGQGGGAGIDVNAMSGTGGSSILGGGAAGIQSNSNGLSGGAYGGGGGGSQSGSTNVSHNGGAGGSGVVIFEW